MQRLSLPHTSSFSRLRHTRPGRPAPGRLSTVFLAASMLLLGCGDDDPSSGDAAADAGAGDTGAPSAQDADPGQTGSTAVDQTGSTTASDGRGGSSTPAFPGQCTVDEVNRQSFYSVANIEDDDVDGGLNVRDDYESGEILATLPEGSVVYAEDCFKQQDGGIWYAIAATDPADDPGDDAGRTITGWVNAAFLSPDIPALAPTFGGAETEETVVALLNALAARRWEDAADELTLADDVDVPTADLLGPPGVVSPADQDDANASNVRPGLADQLADYCRIRVCDGPYTVTEVRGSHLPSRISPEVDVTFTYSGGIVTQTFRLLSTVDGETTVDTLPGQSILAFKRNQPSVGDLAGDAEGLPSGLLEAAEVVRRSLLSESGERIPDDYLPTEGVVVSVDAFVDPDPDHRQVVTGQDLALNGDVERIWGYADGVGHPIVATVDAQMAGYRRAPALLDPDVIGIDTRVGVGNTIDNLARIFQEARIVEFHRRGRGQLGDFNWSSVRLALELRGRQWVVVAIAEDSWTV